MKNTATQTPIHTIGLDIAKNSFSIHGFDVNGVTILTKDLKRAQMLDYGDVVDGARLGHLMCQDGVVEKQPYEGAIHHEEHCHRMLPSSQFQLSLPSL